ncbi:hypothetical protein ACQJBY_035826 [Aegilops geniculata]
MTLEEYEKMQEKKKSLEASKPEERRVAAVDFEGLQLLEKKKIEDDAKLKAENVRKAKEAAAKEAKPRKVSIQEYLKNEDGSAYVPPTPPRRPQYGGGYRGGRGNGSYNGRSSRDNSSERRVYNSGRGESPIVFHNVEANTNDSGAPRRGEGYNGERRQGGYQQGGYNGGRGNGRYQERQDGYNGERREQQQGGYYQERRDAYNGERREQGGYNNGGGRANGGYQERRDGYNGYRRQQGGYNGGRGNGGYQEQGGNNGGRGQDRQDAYNRERRPQGGDNNGGRGNGGNQERQEGGERRQQGGYNNGGNYRQWQGPRPKQDKEFTPADFPALGGASQAQSQAQA